MDDDAGTGQWMTYDELAEVRGIKRIGAVRLVQRYKWRRQAGNDGRARVLVPHDAVEKVRGTDAGTNAGDDDAGTDAGSAADSAAGTTTNLVAGALAALEDAVAALREQLDRAEAGRAEERRLADDLRVQISLLNAELIVAKAGADAMRDRLNTKSDELGLVRAALDQAQAEGRKARAEAEALRREDDARKARGLVARLRAAWQGG